MSNVIGLCRYCRAKRKFWQQTEYRGNEIWSIYICEKCGWQTEAVKFRGRILPQGLKRAD